MLVLQDPTGRSVAGIAPRVMDPNNPGGFPPLWQQLYNQYRLVRPTESPDWLKHIADLRISRAPAGDITKRWGKANNFDNTSFGVQFSAQQDGQLAPDSGSIGDYGFWPGGPGVPTQRRNGVTGQIIYREWYRNTKDVRVENPDDPEQYVIVRRIQSIAFKSTQDGRLHIFNLRPNW